MLSRILVALGLAAAVVSGAAVAFLRSDFVANNLCAYAVATIEEATAARVEVARCSVQPEQGKLTIEGLRVGDPGGRIDLKVARVFAQVKVRPLLQKVRLERLELDHPELRLALDQAGETPPRGGQCLPDVLDRFEFGRVKVRKARVDVRAGGTHVAVPRLSLAIKEHGHQLSVALSTRGGSVQLPGRTIEIVSSRTAALVDLRGTGVVEVRRADVIAADLSAFMKGRIEDLCSPDLDVSANIRVDDLETATARLVPGMLEGVKGGVSTDLSLTLEHGNPHLKGDLRLKAVAIAGFSPGDARVRFDVNRSRLHLEHLELPLGRGQANGTIDLSLADASLPVTADLQLRDMELAELLRKLGLPHAWVVLRTSGRVQVKGTLAPFQLGGEAALDLADFAVLDRSYEKRAQARKMLEFARGRLEAGLAVDKEKIVVQGGNLEVGGSRLQVESTFFTDLAKGMQIQARSEALSLDDLRAHVGPLPARGTLKIAARVGGPYQSLTIEGTTTAQAVRFMDLSLGTVSTEVGFDARSMKLSFADIRGQKDRSRYLGRIAVDFSNDAMPMEAHLELPDAWASDLVDLALGMVPALSPVQDPEQVEAHLTGTIDVKGPSASPSGTATIALDRVSLWGESFDAGSARLSLHGNEPRLQVDDLTLRHGGASVRVAGTFGPAWRLDFRAETDHFALSDLDLLERAKLAGPLHASARIAGVSDHPLVDVSVKFTDATADEAEVGHGDLALHLDGKAMTWKGTVGTHGVEGQARLEGDFPYSCAGTLRVPDLAQYVDLLAPDVNIESGSLTAAFELRGALLRWRESSGKMTLSQLKVVRSDLTFENDGPAEVSFGPDGIRTPRLALRAPFTTAHLSGSRGRDGRLDLRLGASIDGRVVPGLMADVEHASGTFLVQATVSGTAKNPAVLGNVRVEDGSVSLRGLPVQARALNGSISFSQDALVIDSMSGKLNNGDARVSGGMEMERLRPKKIDVSAHISDVNVRLQEALGATVDGDLTLFGPPLEPVLGGSLIVSQMKYTEDLELEKSLLSFSRRPPTPKVLTKSAIVVRFDVDVHLSRGVRIENNLARTDLKGDLKVTGTSRELGLLGSINTVHGTATFRGNEFQIEQGVLSFTDRQRIRPSYDFQATSEIKASGVPYKVRMHAFGTPAEPHLSLASEPSLTEADLGFLLTFGFVSTTLQQSSFSAADSGLAIGVEALNKVTGFSEEVRRFIPKNAILRDPNIDFASDFSVATNRLEPMARFSSHLINDRLDLKILEGLTTRRYRGVISYQLSDAVSTRLQLDNEHITTSTGTDFGVDLHLKWEGE